MKTIAEQEIRQRAKLAMSSQCVDSSNVDQLVRQALASSGSSASLSGMVDVGRPDYAARSNGAAVVTHMTSASFTPDDAWLSSAVAHYFNLDNGVGSPDDALSVRWMHYYFYNYCCCEIVFLNVALL